MRITRANLSCISLYLLFTCYTVTRLDSCVGIRKPFDRFSQRSGSTVVDIYTCIRNARLVSFRNSTPLHMFARMNVIIVIYASVISYSFYAHVGQLEARSKDYFTRSTISNPDISGN